MRRLLVLSFAAAALGSAAAPMPASATRWGEDEDLAVRATERAKFVEPIDGYVPVAQGDSSRATELRMQGEYPKDRSPAGLPTLLIYQGYSHKLGPAWGDPFRDWAMHNGYAVMVVSVRGAGCSGGTYDFLSRQEALDGRDVIRWITSSTAAG